MSLLSEMARTFSTVPSLFFVMFFETQPRRFSSQPYLFAMVNERYCISVSLLSNLHSISNKNKLHNHFNPSHVHESERKAETPDVLLQGQRATTTTKPAIRVGNCGIQKATKAGTTILLLVVIVERLQLSLPEWWERFWGVSLVSSLDRLACPRIPCLELHGEEERWQQHQQS
jgi:hypothetical protein